VKEQLFPSYHGALATIQGDAGVISTEGIRDEEVEEEEEMENREEIEERIALERCKVYLPASLCYFPFMIAGRLPVNMPQQLI
jgi:hypothetical protein